MTAANSIIMGFLFGSGMIISAALFAKLFGFHFC